MFSVYANMAQVVEQLTRNEQVEGSSPSIGSLFMAGVESCHYLVGFDLNQGHRGVAQLGSAFGSGPKGRGFESRHFDTCETLGFPRVFLF